MNRRTPVDLIHEMASELALARELDQSLFERLSALLAELEGGLSSGDDSLRESVLQCRSLLSGLVEGKSNDVDADIASITRSLTVIYQGVRRRAASGPGGDCAPSSRSSGGGFAPPGEIDADAFQEIIASLRLVLEEIEANLVEEVVVEFLERDRASSKEADLRDRFHAIRREAGRLGLLDLERVCLAAEEYMQAVTPGVERADRLLAAKDWIAGALDSYALLKLPGTSHAKIAASLRASAKTRSGGGVMNDKE